MTAASATERSRRHRERVRAGVIVLEVEVDEEQVLEVLTSAGLLAWDEGGKRQAVADAFQAAVNLWLACELSKR
jgi:hypothetical protein